MLSSDLIPSPSVLQSSCLPLTTTPHCNSGDAKKECDLQLSIARGFWNNCPPASSYFTDYIRRKGSEHLQTFSLIGKATESQPAEQGQHHCWDHKFPCECWHQLSWCLFCPQTDTVSLTVVAVDSAVQMKGSFYLVNCSSNICVHGGFCRAGKRSSFPPFSIPPICTPKSFPIFQATLLRNPSLADLGVHKKQLFNNQQRWWML